MSKNIININKARSIKTERKNRKLRRELKRQAGNSVNLFNVWLGVVSGFTFLLFVA